MKYYLLISLFLLVTLFAACIREPGCTDTSSDGNLRLILHWSPNESNPPGVYLLFYPQDGTEPVSDFLPAQGGCLYLPQGKFQVLAYSNHSETIVFRGLERFNTAEAYVEKDIQPDKLFAGTIGELQVKDPLARQTAEIHMESLVKVYPFTFSGVMGLNYIDRIQVYVSGISTAVLLADTTKVLPTDSIRCSFSRTNQGFSGSFRSFGHGDESTAHFFTIRFEYGEESKTYIYDVTEMLNKHGRIDINEKITFDPVDKGGFRPGVDDWDDDSAIVPL